ncbi:NlpC/P60 family protein [Radiobacillus kanasensis]|uniref:coiled-coil domain-containing protein n=1 Tax=Radiobacillus kanasensis TaxID=2844358 RepID=UPI001E60A6D3|nr:C40 family peptidase [Radiobacillus kanasensis]UFT98316.1 NlpC/P60 family protein [Radiobacillus kanasensis]
MLKKKLIILNLSIAVGLASTIAIPNVQAETSRETQIQQERSQIQAKISEAEKVIAEADKELKELNEQVERVDQAIKDNQQKIEDTKKKIETTKAEIAKLEEEIVALEKSIEKRLDILKERAQSFQQSGGEISYLEVIFGSKSFNDFVNRVFAVNTIVQADEDLLNDLEEDKAAVKEKQDSVKKKLEDLNSMMTELEGMQAQILEQKEQNEALKQDLLDQQEKNEALKAALERKDANLASELESFQASKSPLVKAYSTSANFSNVSASGSAATVINAGRKYIGNSVYDFGGGRTASDIANGRFDCSGFVSYAFSQAGISVPASTSSLVGVGRAVSPSAMKPGDMVFFNTYKTNGHVGIYVGGGRFIGSQSSTGVAIANMSSGYWANHFSGVVRRVLN